MESFEESGLQEEILEAVKELGFETPTPIQAKAVEAALQGQPVSDTTIHEASTLVAGEVDPIGDFRGSPKYKRDMAVVFVERTIKQAVTQAKETKA